MYPLRTRILVATPTPPGTVEALKAVSDEVDVVVPGRPLHFSHPDFHDALAAQLDAEPADVLFTDRLPRTWQPDGRLRWVQLAAAGTDGERGKPLWLDPDVVITNAAGIHAAAISEWVCAMLLTHSRSVFPVLSWTADRRWPAASERPSSTLLLQKTVGIIGYGAIGREVARLSRALGMRVVAFNRSGTLQTWAGRYEPPRLADRLAMADDEVALRPVGELDDVLPELDYVVVAAGLNTSTKHLLAAPQFAAMKPTAYLINIARGGLVDERALVEAVDGGLIAGAALDVFDPEPPAPENPLFDLPGTVLSPHSSGGFDDYYGWAHELLRDNLRRFLSGMPLVNVVDRARDV